MFVRILNFFLVALTVATIVSNYRVAEQTRVARAQLAVTDQRIADEQAKSNDLQTQYVQLSRPDNIQMLAENTLGMSDKTTVQLASLRLLPRRGEGEAQVREISAPAGTPVLVKISVRARN